MTLPSAQRTGSWAEERVQHPVRYYSIKSSHSCNTAAVKNDHTPLPALAKIWQKFDPVNSIQAQLLGNKLG
jgi:hypothetical protein